MDGLADATFQSYRRTLLEFAGQHPFLTAREITAIDIRQYLNYCFDRGCGQNTLSNYSQSLRGFFKWAELHELVDKNPMRLIAGPKKKKALPKYLNIAEINRLLSVCGGGFGGVRLSTILFTFAATGLRVSELCRLNLQDYCGLAGTLRVRGKGSKTRIVPVDDLLAPKIDNWLTIRKGFLKERQSSAFFINKEGARSSRYRLYVQIRRAGERAGIEKKISPHILRHSFATIYVANGGQLDTLKEIMGHSTLLVTQSYIHTSAKMAKEDLRRASPLRQIQEQAGVPLKLF